MKTETVLCFKMLRNNKTHFQNKEILFFFKKKKVYFWNDADVHILSFFRCTFSNISESFSVPPRSRSRIALCIKAGWGCCTSSSSAGFWWPWCHLMRSGRMAGLDRCLCGLSVPAPRSRSVAEEKGGGPGADSVSADSAEGGQGHGEGGMPGCERLAKTHTLLAFWQGQAAK